MKMLTSFFSTIFFLSIFIFNTSKLFSEKFNNEIIKVTIRVESLTFYSSLRVSTKDNPNQFLIIRGN